MRRNPSMKSDQIANGITLLVGLAGFVAKPSLIGAVRTMVSTKDLAKKIMANAPPDIKRLAEELTDSAQAVFDGFKHDLPPDADRLYAQMVEFGLPSPQQVVSESMDAGSITKGMLDRLWLTEHVKGSMPGLFRQITQPTLAELLGNRSFADSLTPPFMARVLKDLDHQSALIEDLDARFGSLANALDHLSLAKREQLELLAERFRVENVREHNDDELMAILSERAEELRTARLRISRIDPNDDALAKLKAEADSAAERLDFASVDRALRQVDWALRQVDRAQANDGEATKLARAENALLLGEIELAARLLAASAETFGGEDRLTPARKRLEYLPIMLMHGMRYGLPALRAARELAEDANKTFTDELTARPESNNVRDVSILQANALTFVGMAEFEIGQRESFEAGETAMLRAIGNYRKVVVIHRTLGLGNEAVVAGSNLGIALRTLGSRTEGADGTALLNEAEEVLSAVVAHEDEPEVMIARMSNLGVTQSDIAVRLSGEAALSGLKKAHKTFSKAIEIHRASARDGKPSAINLNLAVVRIEQGRRSSGTVGRDLLTDALGLLDLAEAALPRKDAPQQWALVASTRAKAAYQRALHDTTDDPCPDLKLARNYVLEALSEFTQTRAPAFWKKAQTQKSEIAAAMANAGCKG